MRHKITSGLFLAILAALPLGQIALELARGERPLCLEVGAAFVDQRLPEFEEDLRKASFVRHELVPLYQQVVSQLFGRGNEKAIEGRDGRFFYADDLDLICGTGFLEEGRGGRRAVEVITGFRDALAERDIALCVLPVPVKGMVDAAWLAFDRETHAAPENPDTQAFYDELAAADIDVIDLRAPWHAWAERFPDGMFLPRDTHWRPELMQLTAELVAEHLTPRLPANLVDDESGRIEFEGEGDLMRMLRLPQGVRVWPAMTFELQPVAGELGQRTPTSDVLLLGDSFTEIFSDPELAMGERAGFGERLAVALGRPLDVIALVGGSSTTVREALARREGGLDGKSVVIWEFGFRALGEAADSWRDVRLPPPGPREAVTDPSDAGGGDSGPPVELGPELKVRAELLEATRMREDFDYALCLIVHRYRVLSVERGELADEEVWVAFVGMQDFEVQEPSRFEIGSVQELALEPLEEHYDTEDTTWLDDTNGGQGADFNVPFRWAVEYSPAD